MPKDLNISLLLDFYGEMLSEKQRDIIDDYYNSDLSLSEIAEDKNITRQGVRDSIKRSETQLVDMENKLGLYKKFKNVNEKLLYIIESANKIKNEENHDIINLYADKIISSADELIEWGECKWHLKIFLKS